MATRKKSARAQRTKAAPPNRRGAPDVVEKRLVARAFNHLIVGAPAAKGVDGRVEKRRARLFRDLAGEGRKALKPIDVLGRVCELMELGETLASIRKVRSVPRPRPASVVLVELVARLHAAYAFPVAVYRFVGVGDDVLSKAGVAGLRKKLGRPKRGS